MQDLSKKFLFVALSLTMTCASIGEAKSIKNKYGVTQGGHIPQQQLQGIGHEIKNTLQNIDQSRYEDIVANPESARSDEEKLAALSAREIFIMVDRSGSMNAADENPSGGNSTQWTRWDSARVAAECLSETAIAMDKDNQIEVMLWEGDAYGRLIANYDVFTGVGSIKPFFDNYRPQRGSTPLALALEDLYTRRLQGLLQKSEPFTVIVLTDGSPNDPNMVSAFIKKVVRDNHLESPGRETLAAFSLIRMGDDDSAIAFLKNLDDNLIQTLNINVDIVDTKEDNFLFGTGKFRNQTGVGPFAVLWDAIFD